MDFGEVPFRISQRSPQKITMKLKDYVSYMELQHDEDPLYIFDDKVFCIHHFHFICYKSYQQRNSFGKSLQFGESAPKLLEDYSVPHLFQEDFFDILDYEQRPAFRWFIIGPERSGASWHVDPGLTSAWNTLLCGRKRLECLLVLSILMLPNSNTLIIPNSSTCNLMGVCHTHELLTSKYVAL